MQYSPFQPKQYCRLLLHIIIIFSFHAIVRLSSSTPLTSWYTWLAWWGVSFSDFSLPVASFTNMSMWCVCECVCTSTLSAVIPWNTYVYTMYYTRAFIWHSIHFHGRCWGFIPTPSSSLMYICLMFCLLIYEHVHATIPLSINAQCTDNICVDCGDWDTGNLPSGRQACQHKAIPIWMRMMNVISYYFVMYERVRSTFKCQIINEGMCAMRFATPTNHTNNSCKII